MRKKDLHTFIFNEPPGIRRSFKRMTILLVLMCITYWDGYALQPESRVTLKSGSITIAGVFEEIKKQTGLVAFYNNSLLNDKEKLAVNFDREEIVVVMREVLKGKRLSFEVNDKYILITALNTPKSNSNNLDTLQNKAIKDIKVSGRVADEQGQGLPGVSVGVKGTSIGTITNADGRFQINIPSEKDILVFRMIGFEAKELTVLNRREFNITLKEDVKTLKEVAVVSTGYQTISKERVTGAYDVVGKDQLDKPTTNLAQRLIGTTTGVQATLDANGNPTFEIRGQTSLYANAQPLLVVDGFPVDGGFNSINPNDVESVTILKDAAAASIWGARAANGVLVVTTKKAVAGTPLKIEFTSFAKIGAKTDLDYINPLATSGETVDYEKMAFNRWGAIQNNGNLIQDYNKAYSQGLTALNEYLHGNITEQEKENILSTLRNNDNRQQIRDYMLAVPVSQQYNLTVSSATPRSNNILSLFYANNQSRFKNTNSQDYMLNYRTTSVVLKWLDFRFSGMFQYTNRNNSGNSLSDIRSLSPYDMLADENGKFINVINTYYQPIIDKQVPVSKFPYSDWSYNPVSEMNNREIGQEDMTFRFQTGFTAKLLKGLSYDAAIQYEQLNTENKNLNKENSFFVRNTVNTTSTWNKTTNTITPNITKGAILARRQSRMTGYNFRNQLNFNRQFGKHMIDAVGGTEIISTVIKGSAFPTVYGLNEDKLTVGNFPNGVTVKNWMNENYTFSYNSGFSEFTSRYFSMYANAAYTFDNKYTVSGSVRSDASNLITNDPAYRYSPFWSAGVRWQIQEEKFMKSAEWVNRLALRVTYGYNGNVDKSTSFMPLISLSANPDLYTNENTATISSYGNPTLRWEKIGTFNVGLDYMLFDRKLFGKIDFYQKNGEDLLAQISIPAINGTSSQKFNNAEMINSGVEVEVGTSLNFHKVKWTSSLNFSYNHNKITDLYRATYDASDLSYGGTSAYVEGRNAQTLWAYKYAGIANAGTPNSPDWQPMIIGQDDTPIAFSKGRPVGNATAYMLNMGTRVAPYVVGLVNQFKLYNFDLSFILTGKFGHVFRRHSFNYPLIKSKALPNARYSEVLNADPMKILPLPQNDLERGYNSWSTFYPFLDYLTESANHVRLQEVNLSYNISDRLLKKAGINSFSVFAQGNNLFILTNNKYDEDPENPLGTDRLQAMYTFGLKFNF